ncbi:MAG: division/cell wall cluster transcriptional repressor MraZ [Candidatus Coatesbacteria bacterium]
MDQNGTESTAFEFTGTYNHGLDAKGRLTLPAAFREHLNETSAAKFAIWLDKQCIAIYPLPVWRQFLAKLQSLPWTDARSESVKRVVLSSAFNCEVDKQGRTVLPPHLRELVGIGREVTLVGKGQFVEVWDRAKWADYFKRGHESLEADASRLTL